MPSSPDELFDVTDEQDNVIGQKPRWEVHQKNLLHRAVHIWVYRPDGKLVVHVRSETKDQYPSCFTSSASGHLDVGEDYLTAAHRELQEELGIAAELEFLLKLPAGPQTAYEHTVVYQTVTDLELTPEAEEIAELKLFTMEQVQQMVNESPEQFTPPFVEIVKALVGTRQ